MNPSKLKSYSLAAASFLFLKSNLKAEIVYVDIEPDIILDSDTDINLDIDMDGSSDFLFVMNSGFRAVHGIFKQRGLDFCAGRLRNLEFAKIDLQGRDPGGNQSVELFWHQTVENGDLHENFSIRNSSSNVCGDLIPFLTGLAFVETHCFGIQNMHPLLNAQPK